MHQSVLLGGSFSSSSTSLRSLSSSPSVFCARGGVALAAFCPIRRRVINNSHYRGSSASAMSSSSAPINGDKDDGVNAKKPIFEGASQHPYFDQTTRQTAWEKMWQNEEKKGESKPKFDCDKTEPALVHFLANNASFVPELRKTKSARVLVPGCGRGYALETFSSTFDSENVVGLEVSETAREACERYQTENGSKAKCVVDDFFAHDVASDDEKYDVIYDCTFLCAIQPFQRQKWAEQMKKLTAKGSRLISLVFPLGDFEGGPPFALSPELVKSLLESDFDVEELIQVPEADWARGRPEYLYVFVRR
jgi:SAM-dependent methyltransferase